MSWLKEVIGTEKAIISMLHLQAMPGDPGFDREKGMKWVVEKAKEDLDALQEGGVDAIMFSNEYSLPYLTRVRTETVAAMARVIGELKQYVQVPYGVNVLWDPKASLDLHRGICKRFRYLGYELRGNGAASACNRCAERQTAVQHSA